MVKNFEVNNFLGSKKIFGQKDLGLKISLSKKIQVGLTQGGGFMTPPHPTQKIVGLKLCWVVVSLVRWGCLQNFRPLGLVFLVEVEFLVGGVGGWVVVWTAIIVSNPTRLRLGWVVLGWGFDNMNGRVQKCMETTKSNTKSGRTQGWRVFFLQANKKLNLSCRHHSFYGGL